MIFQTVFKGPNYMVVEASMVVGVKVAVMVFSNVQGQFYGCITALNPQGIPQEAQSKIMQQGIEWARNIT